VTVESFRARAFADVETVIAEVSRGLTDGLPDCTPADQRLLSIAAEHARAAVTEMGKHPLEFTLAWPAGVPKDARDTLTAQLHGELQRMAFMRLRLEFLAVYTLAPQIARSTAEWLRDVASSGAA